MAYDGMVTRAIAYELNERLSRGKIEKIYQPEREEIVLVIRTREGRYKLYLSCAGSHCGAYISEEDYVNPPSPSAFCMLLRKHMQGGVLLEVVQKDCERILEIVAESFDELGVKGTKRLIIEIMGRHSNILFVDDATGKILDAVKRVSIDVNRDRQILPGFPYEYPADGGKVPFACLPAAEITGFPFLSEREPADVLLDHVQGLSPLMAREVMTDIDIPADWDTNVQARMDISGRIAGRLEEMTQQLECGHLSPCVYVKEDGTPADFHVLSILQYEGRYEKRSFETASEAAAWYYAHRDASNRVRQRSADVTKAVNAALKKARLKKQRILEDLEEAKDGERYRLYGELLTANLHAFRTGDPEVTVTNYYNNEPITIPLDIRYAPAKNAQLYFKKYSKSKVALKEKQIRLEETDKDIAYLESVADLAERAQDVQELAALKEELIETGFIRRRKQSKASGKNKKDRPQPYVYKSSSGLDILAGRNNKENDYLTFRVAGRNDLWFHTKDIPGSHVILFCRNKEPDDRSVYEAAQIAAFHSKGSRSENVPVDYTKVRYVKKPNGAKPGMVIFTDNHTVYVEPKLPGHRDLP